MTITKLMPPGSKVWIYQSDRKFTSEELVELNKRVSDFVDKWTSHSKLVNANFEWRYSRFLILYLDESHVAAGGCSIDSSVHFVKALEKDFQTSLTNRMNFAFKVGNEVEVVSRSEFEKLISEGEITDQTIVFNNLVNNKKDFDSAWEIPLNQSWHKQFFTVKA